MGVDLRLLPLDHFMNGWGYSHTVLPLPRNYELWEAVKALPVTPIGAADISAIIGQRVPDGTLAGEPTYGRLTTDAYGCPYTMVRAGDLGPLLQKYQPNQPSSAFTQACDPERLVVLDWH